MTHPTLFELRTYRLTRAGDQTPRLSNYLQHAFIPAATRAGCGAIGVFSVATGPGNPSLRVLIPYASLNAVLDLPGRLAADADYRAAAEPFLAAGPTDPPYQSLDIKLMRGFAGFPTVETPDTTAPRLFELRTYHSHGERAGAKKIEMFDTAGEIAIFRRVGLAPVFFAEDLTGPDLPSLTYMLVFADHAAREQAWRTFIVDPEWKALVATPGFTDPEIVTGIDSLLLAPTSFSGV